MILPKLLNSCLELLVLLQMPSAHLLSLCHYITLSLLSRVESTQHTLLNVWHLE